MDNVPTLAIQGPIVRELPNVFNSTAVYQMSTDLIEKIAGEDEGKVRERAELSSKLETLKTGQRICRQYVLHGVKDQTNDEKQTKSQERDLFGKPPLFSFADPVKPGQAVLASRTPPASSGGLFSSSQTTNNTAPKSSSSNGISTSTADNLGSNLFKTSSVFGAGTSSNKTVDLSTLFGGVNYTSTDFSSKPSKPFP